MRRLYGGAAGGKGGTVARVRGASKDAGGAGESPARRAPNAPGFCLRNISQAGILGPVTDSDPGSGQPPGPLRYLGLGVQLALTLVLAVLVGRWLDRRLDTGSLCTFVAAFLGFGVTMYWLVRGLDRSNGAGK